jgi:hypothetical protein
MCEPDFGMPTWPVRFDGVPTAVKSAPLLGEHTAEVLADWLGLDADAVAGLRRDGINPGISVLFSDIQMPGMGGEELAAIALTLRPGIRVIFTSGFQTPPGDVAFVPKPYRAVDLIRVLPPQPLPSLRSLIAE